MDMVTNPLLLTRSASRGKALLAPLLLIVLGLLGGCMSLPVAESGRQPSYTAGGQGTALGRNYRQTIAAHPGKSGFVVMGGGIDAFAARMELIRQAQRSIDVQYYIAWDDVAGAILFRDLIAAADRGVRVRVLLDDLHLNGTTQRMALLDSHPNIEVRAFNPFRRDVPRAFQYLFHFGELSRRMHNKSMVFDNTVTIVGGRNVGAEYAGAHADHIFSELEVLGVGPVAGLISSSFDRYWNSRFSVEIGRLASPPAMTLKEMVHRCDHKEAAERYLKQLAESPLAADIRHHRLALDWGRADLIADPPEKIRQKIPRGGYLAGTGLAPYIADTRRELWIISPYLIPGREGIDYFRGLRQRGLAMTILTNTYISSDVPLVAAHYAHYRRDILDQGIELHEFKPNVIDAACCLQQKRLFLRKRKAVLHAKSLTFDRERFYVGSMNMDPRSIYENTELGLVIHSPKLSQEITTWFDKNLSQFAYELEPGKDGGVYWEDLSNDTIQTVEPDTHILQRLWMGVLGLTPGEALL